ncbi:helix-turn-helix transcriptional regulator [Microtetraspora malaysiensis]|uniref:helix-turn-helix transcriptional regulator n=1 Tax=Microtetraspora malaysiensis TaxID=161358 RepID=UPI001471F1AD|nr:LuxR C-terminal-related transcriptional regulator [Microtetraspora malaysiensis]
MTDASHAEKERHVRMLYARMHEQGESLAEATEQLGLSVDDLRRAQDGLVRLGLLDTGTETTVDAVAALTRGLESSHRALDRLVEHHVRVASLAQNYLGFTRHANDDLRVEFYERERLAALNNRIDELADLAQLEVMTMHPAANWTPERLDTGDARIRRRRSRGVRERELHAQAMLANPMLRDRLRARREEGTQIRVAPVIPTRMLIYDRQVAVVQADPEDLERGAVLIRGRDVIRSLAALYEFCWTNASELVDVPRSADDAALTEQQRAVLRLLATGAKDDAIARSLGVSTRTVTRLVGELTAMLGAGSRFQAGVRAARLGWLD